MEALIGRLLWALQLRQLSLRHDPLLFVRNYSRPYEGPGKPLFKGIGRLFDGS